MFNILIFIESNWKEVFGDIVQMFISK